MCGRIGHHSINCQFKKTFVESNIVTTNQQEEKHNKEEWNVEVGFAIAKFDEKPNQNKDEMTMSLITTKENELAVAVATLRKVDNKKHWIIESGCLNHITKDKKKFLKFTKYNEGYVIVFVNNAKLLIYLIKKQI